MVKIYIRSFSTKVKNLREEKNLTQEELAEQLGISRQSIISVERGKNLPSLPLALRIAEIFDRSFDELFFGKQNKKNNFEGVKTMSRGLMPWSPLGDLDRFFDDEEAPQARARFRPLAVPPVNVKQTEKEIILTADIPGVKDEDLNIEIGDEFVDLTGVRKEEQEDEEEGYYRKEVSYGSFARRIPLPAAVNSNKAEATIKDGQLKVVLPKLEPTKPKVTKIKIKKEA
jgi:HSP20 family protein